LKAFNKELIYLSLKENSWGFIHSTAKSVVDKKSRLKLGLVIFSIFGE
jgi:hypothetical protein